MKKLDEVIEKLDDVAILSEVESSFRLLPERGDIAYAVRRNPL